MCLDAFSHLTVPSAETGEITPFTCYCVMCAPQHTWRASPEADPERSAPWPGAGEGRDPIDRGRLDVAINTQDTNDQ